MGVLEAVILGVVQGLTEFFPVSSSGHLVMTERVLGLSIPGIRFEIAVHLATLLSVLLVYRRRVAALVRGVAKAGAESTLPYHGKLALATVPAAAVGLLFRDWFAARFEEPVFAGTMVLVTGSVVWSSRWVRVARPSPLELVPIGIAAVVSAGAGTAVPFVAVLAVEAALMGIARATAPAEWEAEPGWGAAALMGVAQAAAILPGVSRSGSTVVTGLWRRVDPAAAAEFSFLMSIPAILGAALLTLPEAETGTAVATGAVPLAAGTLGAAMAGVLAIRFFVALLRRQNFHVFAWYCWAVGAAFLITQ